MELLYKDRDIVVCIKPAGVLSTDEPGGLPELVRQELGDPAASVRTVHRLDRVVSGLMVLATRRKAASELSRQIRENTFEKEYLAVVHGRPEDDAGVFRDLLVRDRLQHKSFVVTQPGPDAQEAVLEYEVLAYRDNISCLRIRLHTGRTHQIRVQLASRGMPIFGDAKYGTAEDECDIALWSWRLAFAHPYSGEKLEFKHRPPQCSPWTDFDFSKLS